MRSRLLMADLGPAPGGREPRSGFAEGRLGLLHQRVEGRRLPRRQIREHLAVDGDAGPLDAVDQLRVGQAVLAGAGVDALDPQRAEVALAVATVAIGVLERLLDALERDAVVGRGTAEIAGPHVDDLLVTGVRRDAPLDASHGA